jgi:alkyl sulfatase BDS1-like metallo-beta-lactamase superfamily hydrolase
MITWDTADGFYAADLFGGTMSDRRGVVVGDLAQRQGFFGSGEAIEVRPKTFFLASFGNVSAFETTEGLLMVDTGLRQFAASNHDALRKLTTAWLHTAVFTHGHVDHAFGLGPWFEEAEARHRPRPRVVAHENVVHRFHTYRRMKGLNEHINSVQFGLENVGWPTEFFWPDATYHTSLTLLIGDERFELRHGKGETDDATWVWAPERKVLCAGDFWINCAPNCGNPQKVQRYPEEWIVALEEMASLGAEVLLPGHGPLIEGADEIRDRLSHAAAYLRAIVDQTVDLLNQGLPHDEIVESVRVPEALASKPYLQPVYDRPEFIVRNLIRRLGGWWDGYPADVLSAPAVQRAREIAALAGGADKLVARARELQSTDARLACHLAEWAVLAEPSSQQAQECVRDVFRSRAESEISLMGRGIFMHAVRGAERALSG